MAYHNLLAGFQNSLSYMGQAQGRIQEGFYRAYEKDSSITPQQSADFTSAFVEEDFAARLAEAQLKALKSHDEMTQTLINIKS